MKFINFLVVVTLGLTLAACGAQPDTSTSSAESENAAFEVIDGVKTKKVEGFGGVIAESYDDSKE